MRTPLLVLTLVLSGLTACSSPQAAPTPPAPAPSANECPTDPDAVFAPSADPNCFAVPIDRYDPGSEGVYEDVPDPFASGG